MIRKLLSRAIASIVEAEVAKRMAVPVPPAPRQFKISEALIARAKLSPEERALIPEIGTYKPRKGVVPEAKLKDVMAMDATDYSEVNEFYAGAHFKGYSYLSTLSQKPEYRKMSE